MQWMVWKASSELPQVPSPLYPKYESYRLSRPAPSPRWAELRARDSSGQRSSPYIAWATAYKATPRVISGLPSTLGIGVASSLQHQLVEGSFGVAVVVECTARVGTALSQVRRQSVLEALGLVQRLL